jgi:hypothetical protein
MSIPLQHGVRSVPPSNFAQNLAQNSPEYDTLDSKMAEIDVVIGEFSCNRASGEVIAITGRMRRGIPA